MPVNYVMLAVISGIIGIVLAGFTGWHILLASRGQTTIECLEKTRYLSPLKKAAQHRNISDHETDEIGGPNYGQQLHDMETHALVDGRPEEGAIPFGQARHHTTYDMMERQRARQRYEEYLDEQDSEKLPSAFDLGRKRNFRHLFGTKKLLWPFPICTTIGDGWSWEPSPKWLAAREKIAREREEQKARERAAGWGEESPRFPPPRQEGAGRHYIDARPTPSRPLSKADRILGRDPSQYADESSAVSLQTLNPRRNLDEDEYDISSDEDEADRKALDRKASAGWPRKVGVVTNTLLGNTLARKKDDVRGWDGIDEGVD